MVQDNSWRTPTSYKGGAPRAVLVDELSATVPDPSFIDSAKSELSNAGYAVDYIGPADVTVEFFRDLPLKGYSLEVLRTHGGASQIYTSEPYSSSKYVLEQLTDQVASVLLNNQLYFAITTKFVRGAMHGTFPGSLVIEMGCSGLAGTEMAQAFLDRGATAFVGWDRAVSASHTDHAIMNLLGALAQGESLKDAVSSTVSKVGLDPSYQSRLGYYDSTLGPRQKATESLLALSGLLAIVILPVAAIALITIFPKFFGRT